MVKILIILLMLLLVGGLFYVIKRTKDIHKINAEVDEENKRLSQVHDELCKEYESKTQALKELENSFSLAKEKLEDIQNNITKTIDNQKELSERAFENYVQVLENKYKEEEEDYEKYTDAMQTAYSNLQLKLIQETEQYQEELKKVKATRAATFQALTKEKEIQDNKDNYRLNLSEKSLRDIKKLKSIQDELSLPIVVDKIIWSNYYQPIAKTTFPKIIGKATACGIYKITSLIDGSVYVGQSVDLYKRFNEHSKNALGVGNTAANNKLYKTMQEQGLHNFTFEVLEECDAKYLDEKEKYYIDLYDSYNFGLNGNRGNK